MQESYIVWQGKSSKDLGLICENVIVSQPEQKNKILQTASTDNNYIYTTLNSKNRPFFENRIITVSSYFKYKDLEDKTAKLSEIMNWLYSYNYRNENYIKVLPDYKNVIWEDCKIENIQQIEKVSAHTIKIIFQFRVNCFSSDTKSQITKSNELDFTEGQYALYFTNKGFYTQDYKIILTGACNYFSIENINKDILIDIPGFTEEVVIDFKYKAIIVDGEEKTFNIDYYELVPGENFFKLESDGNVEIEFDVINKYLYSYEEGTKNEIKTEILID